MTTTTTRPPAAAESGEDKLIAVARHIARTIGRTDTMTDDIIQIFSSFDRRFSREKLEPRRGAAAADRKIRSLDRKVSMYLASTTPIWSGCESEGFLRAVDGVVEAWREVHATNGEVEGDQEAYRAVMEAADGLLHRVMLRLEDEFRILMDQCAGNGGASNRTSPGSSPPQSPRGDAVPNYCSSPCPSSAHANTHTHDPVADYHNLLLDCLPWGTMSDLYEIAKRMSAAGYGKACALAYSVPRLASLQDTISRLGFHFDRWTTEEVHAKPWPELAEQIRRWTHAAKVAFRVLFPSERRLCDRVFPDSLSPVADLAFADVCRDPALGILGFADAVAVGSKAPDRLFAVVEMYETLRDLVPDVDALFLFAPEGEDGGCRFVRSEAAIVCERLGVTVRGMLAELQNLVRRDTVAPANNNKEKEAALPGGGIHPITRYVLNYLCTVCASARTLEEILQEEEWAAAVTAPTAPAPAGSHAVGPSSALATQVGWITEILVTNLEEKSKAYRDPALAYIFLMNNGRYMIQKAKGTELGQLLGDDWLHRQSAQLRQWHGSYQKASWSKLVAIIQHHQPDGAGDGAASAKSLRSRLRRFNVCLDELCEAQIGWVVGDEQLRAEIRISAVGMVLPAYRNLLGRVRALEAGRQQQVLERCVKYAPEDVEAKINGIFQGSWKKA